MAKNETIRDLVKSRIIDEMIHPTTSDSGWKVLVVDHLAMRIMSAACRMYDIVDEGISLVESLEKGREPLPEAEAVYFLTPCEASIKLVVKDFEKHPLYKAVHLFFTSHVTNDLFSLLKGCKPLVQRLKVLNEMNLEFLAIESQAFSLDCGNALKPLFAPQDSLKANEAALMKERIVKQLTTFCASLKEFPIMRYAKTKNNLPSSIAGKLTDSLNQYWQSSDARPIKDRATLLILDRTVDVLAPVLHEYTYQAMVMDVLNVENNRFKYDYKDGSDQTASREVLLDEHDKLWPRLRHMHIADTIQTIIEEFNEFTSTNKAAAFQKGDGVSNLGQMSDAIRAMPQYKELLGKYSLHLELAGKCMDKFTQNLLEDVSTLEQNMVMGKDVNGKDVDLIPALVPILQNTQVLPQDKLRLLMLYIISQKGVKERDRQSLIETSEITIEDENAVSNLKYLDVSLGKSDKAKKKSNKAKRKEDDVPYELSRYITQMKMITEDLLADKLDESKYPYLGEDRPGKSSRAAEPAKKSRWGKSKGKEKKKRWGKTEEGDGESSEDVPLSGSRLIIFIAGGMTHSEMRVVYKLQEKYKRPIIIGSTDVITPKIFVDQLRSLQAVKTLDG